MWTLVPALNGLSAGPLMWAGTICSSCSQPPSACNLELRQVLRR